jgi:integrase
MTGAGEADRLVWAEYFDAESSTLRSVQLNNEFNRIWASEQSSVDAKITAAAVQLEADRLEAQDLSQLMAKYAARSRPARRPAARPLSTRAYDRDPLVIAIGRKRADHRCELIGCEHPIFETVEGDRYVEIHHIVPLADGSEDAIENVACLCPAHHYVNVCPTTFDEMVDDGRMPKPVALSERRFGWIQRELDASVGALPRRDETGRSVPTENMSEQEKKAMEKFDAARKAAQAKKSPAHIDAVVDRRNEQPVVRYYYRVGKGPRIPLLGVPYTDEFMASYQAAAEGRIGIVMPSLTRRPTEVRTISLLIADYRANNEQFKRNRAGTTKKGYGSRLRAIDRDYGDCPLVGFTRERIIDFLEDFDDKPGSGLDTHKKLKILVKHAINIGWMKGDPMVGLKRPAGGSIRPWTEDEVEQFKERWPLGTRQHLAFCLTEFLGQRRSDTHRMCWTDISPRTGRIKVVQQKTDTKLEILIHEDLLYVLDDAHAKRGKVVGLNDPIIKTEAGIGFTVAGFSDWFRDAITAAGLPLDCKPHGLRHLAGVRMSEAGCTDEEMMAVLGHRSATSLRIYTKGAEQWRLGENAIAKVEQNRHKSSPTRSFKFGELPKRERNTAT